MGQALDFDSRLTSYKKIRKLVGTKLPERVKTDCLVTSLKMILVKGVLCAIQVRRTFKIWSNGREYARLDVGRDIMKAALFAVRRGHRMNLYLIPISHLRNGSSVYIPADGKYAAEAARSLRKTGRFMRKHGTG